MSVHDLHNIIQVKYVSGSAHAANSKIQYSRELPCFSPMFAFPSDPINSTDGEYLRCEEKREEPLRNRVRFS